MLIDVRSIKMHTRHTNLLATAHFLKTKSEPVLVGYPMMQLPVTCV